MAQADFTECTKRVLSHEGGYGFDSRDPGGPTNYGITCYDYAAFKGKTMNSMATWAPIVKAMPLADAMAIYRKKYWDNARCDELPAGVDYAYYDYGINSGPARSAKVLQTLLKVPVTGKINDATVAAARKVDPDKLVDAMCDERLHFMKGIRGGASWKAFGKGWGIRVADVRSVAHRMSKTAAATALPAPAVIPAGDMARATHIDPQATKTLVKTGAAGAAVQTPATASYGWGYAAAAVIAILAAVGVAVLVVKRQQAAAQDAVVLPPGVAPLTQS